MKAIPYLEISCPKVYEDWVTDLLFSTDLYQMETTYSGPNCIIKVYIMERDPEMIYQLVRKKLSHLHEKGYLPFYFEPVFAYLIEQDWIKEWKKDYKPIYIDNELVIIPSFWEYKKKAEELVIKIFPQMAFGTGYHETTKLCLMLAKSISFENKIVIDLGTGSGILGITALKMGSSEGILIDNDLVALENCQHNLEINHCTQRAKVMRLSVVDDLPSIKPYIHKADIIMINILSYVIKEFLYRVNPILLPDTVLILSGILKEELEEMEDFLKKMFPQRQIQSKILNEWVGFLLR